MKDTSWNYRVVFHGGFVWVCEVYYTDGVPVGYCEATPGGDTLDELKQDLARMSEALELPILNASEIKERKP